MSLSLRLIYLSKYDVLCRDGNGVGCSCSTESKMKSLKHPSLLELLPKKAMKLFKVLGG